MGGYLPNRVKGHGVAGSIGLAGSLCAKNSMILYYTILPTVKACCVCFYEVASSLDQYINTIIVAYRGNCTLGCLKHVSRTLRVAKCYVLIIN